MTKVEKQAKEVIGPEEAAEYLRYNTHNRSMSKSRVEKYTEAMMAGEWWNNHDPIKIFLIDNGPVLLVSGQKRLTAVMRSGKAYEFDVLWLSGSREECELEFAITDGVEPRSGRNAVETAFDLDLGGVAATEVAIAARAVAWLDRGLTHNTYGAITGQILVKTAHAHRDEVLFGCDVRSAFRRGMRTIISVGLVSASVEAYRHDRDLARTFYVQTGEREMLSRGMPQDTLAKYILNDRWRTKGDQIRLFSHANMAWNAFAEGRKLFHFSPKSGVAVHAIAPHRLRLLGESTERAAD